ncbi:MAG: DNA primase [Gammaproteobacteria bacterium]|nr:DNA primase [Gammaproteobacteria bacterium]
MAGTIPQNFIDELIQAVDIVELIDGYVPLKKTGTSYSSCCPFHSEKTPSFHVIPQKQFFYCFGCGVSGNAIKFLMQHVGLAFTDAIQQLADQVGMTVPVQVHPQHQQNFSLQELLEQIHQHYRKSLYQKPSEVIQYIKSRGLTQSMIDEFGIGYAPNQWHGLEQHFHKHTQALLETGMIVQKEESRHQYYDRFRHRLMFPLHNRHGKLIGFAGRVIDKEQKPKYMNSPETPLFHKQRELYGLSHVLKHYKTPEFIVVVEGYLDVISLFQYGIPHAVATMGTATSHYHLQMLQKYTSDIIFCFDGDAAGQQAALRALENAMSIYNEGAKIRFLFLPEQHDPDSYIREFGMEAMRTEIKKALPLHQFFCKHLNQQYGKMGSQKLIQEAQKWLKKCPEGPGQELLIEEIARLTRLDPYRVRLWLKNEESIPTPTVPKKIATPLRLAAALLIQEPALYHQLPTQLKQMPLPEPLNLILATLKEHASVTTASFVEYFRETPFYESFNKLAVLEHQISEDQQLTSLQEIFDFLQRQYRNESIEQLLNKLKEQGLSLEEKSYLQELLQQRHQGKTSSIS